MASKPVVGVSIQAKLDDAMLGRTGQQIHQQTDRIAKTAGNSWADQFAKSATVDPSKLANTSQFGQQGQKAGKAMGDGAAAAVRKGDWAGAARDSARTFEMTFEKVAKPRASVDTSQMQREGGSAGDSFASGFASAGGLMKLAGKGGPIAGAIIAAVGVAVKTVKPMIEDAMKIDAAVAMAGARGGLSSTQLAEYRKFATDAWARNSGASIDANVSTAVTAMQSGLGADQTTIEYLNTVSSILGEEIPAVARSAGQLIRTGLAENAKQAFDILVSGQQNGLNVSQDWLDTVDEYATQFRALGLNGADSIGLLNQMVKAGARNTDVAADALKELAIRAQDGSKATTDAFNRLGLNAADMASKISAGGDTARTAFDQILDAIRNTEDPVAQMQIAVALLGTKAEDLGDAFKAIDLTTAANSIKGVEGAAQNAADTALRTSQNEWAQAGRNIEKIWQGVKDSLNMGEWFSTIPKAFNEMMADAPKLTPGAPGVPLFSGPGPTIAPPGTPGANLNPLDVITGQHTNGTPAAPGVPAPGPTPGQWWGPNMVAPPVNPRFGSQYDRAAEAARGGSSGPDLPVVPFSGNPMDLLQGRPVNATTYGAAQSVIDAQNRVAQAQANVNALMADGAATQEQIIKQQNDLQAAQSDQLQAQMRFNESMMQATQTATDGMSAASDAFGEIGANLDADLGFSKGLPGLADNLVRFLASLATAPLQGVLSQIAKGGNNSTGFAQSYAQQSYMPQGFALPTSGTPRQYQKGMVPNNVNMLRDLEALFPGLTMSADTGRQDKYNEHGSGQALDIMVGNNKALGDQINQYLLANADRYGLKYNLWQQQEQYPDGRVVPMTDRGSATQNHMDHVHARVAPGAPAPFAQPGTGLPNSPYASALPTPGVAPGLPAPGTVPTGGPLSSGFPTAYTPAYAPTTPSEQAAPSWTPQGGGQLGSGFLGMAMGLASGAAGMGANMFAPGSGAAAQAAADMAQKAIQRTIAFGGQAAGIAMQGLQETFGVSDPDGGGSGLGSSWLTRIAGGLAGAKPAGNMAAGKADQKSEVDPKADPNRQQPQQGNTFNVTNNLTNGTQRDNPQQLLNDLSHMQQQAQW